MGFAIMVEKSGGRFYVALFFNGVYEGLLGVYYTEKAAYKAAYEFSVHYDACPVV